MPQELIAGVVVKKLTVHCDERGRLMEMLRRDDSELKQINFGQLYMTAAYPGVVKAWHYHKKQTDHFVCIKGMAKVVLYDSRVDSPTSGMVNEFFMGEHSPLLVEIPNFVYHGFKTISEGEAIVVNYTSETYNAAEPDEYRVDPHSGEIPYDWDRKDR